MNDSPDMAPETPPAVVLFDGVCNLCNASVNFLVDRDPERRLHFASLQSDVGAALAAKVGIEPDQRDTMVLVEGDRGSVRSTAALRIARYLGFPWKLLYYAGILVPRFIRDAIYRFTAARRYKWFGKSEMCRLPSPEDAGRFLG